MLNLFITYQCNFNCDYCFIQGFGNEYPMVMDKKEFNKLCGWLEKHKVPTLGILGGEPTMHPDLVAMLEQLNEVGVAPVLFTNGLFKKELRKPLAESVVNFVINYNDPSMYTTKQWQQLQENIKGLKEQAARVSFSKNFSKGKISYDYILAAAAQYGISNIRYDISRPNPLTANNYFNLEDARELVSQILEFVRACEQQNIHTGLDCCIPMCYFTEEALDYMRHVSMKFSGICHPSIDIQSDLSATYCIPMKNTNLADITEFNGEMEVLTYFNQQVREIRKKASQEQCVSCDKFGRQCQGGCLALK
ncbi:radical SAM protein [Acetobacterium woodii]|uniref:Molybdenum cofactor biosynthesis protein MoaA1 n=1 Tax=Acetobacterium woodii (strain ATCC 29683 / DSM 1030 / JCM 2381 / KCTC 1655 / WB1) TaxID=931626 RepID=H6LJS0_ACEWD|nr:radical SAM protein [Acetobacterium woodii]AFA47471.1 molybdenum cofactor biosynthesis protein MoaA1 [Acetobacterium woodii DSM 1030]